VDGNDVLAVHGAAQAAVERARAGQGASLIECKTMRIRGHSEHDDASYVPKSLVEEWRAKDPIRQFEGRLREWAVLSDAEEAALTGRIAEELEAAVVWAEASPYPDPKEVDEGVYST
jgi:pyruvate dehydrogenase E1 component alpha subunit